MFIEAITVSLKSDSDKDVAISMYKFWKYQYEQAKTKYNSSQCELVGANKANEEALRLWQEDKDNMSWFGPSKPYRESQIKNIEERVQSNKVNLEEATAMYNYFMTYIFDNLNHV